jgi:hypothetical protein
VAAPALFNRRALNWFSDRFDSAFFQVGREFAIKTDLDKTAETVVLVEGMQKSLAVESQVLETQEPGSK